MDGRIFRNINSLADLERNAKRYNKETKRGIRNCREVVARDIGFDNLDHAKQSLPSENE